MNFVTILHVRIIMSDWLDIIGTILISVGIGIATSIIIDRIIDKATIKLEVKKKKPSAFKAIIEKKKKNAVDVGIFSNDNKRIDELTLESHQGISSDVQVGQVLYI